MTEEEGDIMKQHATYWKDGIDRGFVIAFGPVLGPKGIYGLGIVEVESEERARAFAANDPSIKSGLNTAEVHPIRATVRR
jgi:uncharacterized protein YciI